MWVAHRLNWMWGREWILKWALLCWLDPNGEVYPNVFEQWPMLVSSSLPHVWPLPHPAPPRELGLSMSCYPPGWTTWESLHLRCLSAAVTFKSLERTPPLCLLRSLPAKQGMACISSSAWCVKGLRPAASLYFCRGRVWGISWLAVAPFQ